MLRTTKTVKVKEPRIYGLGWLIGYVEVEKEVEEVEEVLAETAAHKDEPAKDNDSTSQVTSALAAGVEAQKESTTLTDPLPDPKNPLEPFYKKLEEESAHMERLKDEWIKHKINYIKGEKPHPEHDHAAECPIETADKAKSAASNFFAQIRDIFLNARDSLEEKIDEAVKMHIKPLHEHIAKILKDAQDEAKTEDERRELAIHAANAYILLAADTNSLFGNIRHDIEQRVAREAKLESTTSILVNAAIYLIDQITGIPFPYLSFDCTERYAHSLDNQIVVQEVEALELAGAVEGLSEQGARIFADLEQTPVKTGNSLFALSANDNNAAKNDLKDAQEQARSLLCASSNN